MTALSKDFDTKVKAGNRYDIIGPVPIAASQLLYQGALVGYDTAGRLAEVTVASGLNAIGASKEQYDNSSGAAGAIDGEVDIGVHRFANHGTQTLVQADVGKPCYLYDDNTVGKLSATSGGIVGLLEEIKTGYVYVDVKPRNWEGYLDPNTEAKENADATLAVGITEYTINGTDASALPDGNYIGQRKLLLAIAAAATPVLVVTPVSLKDFTTITLDAVGEFWLGRWNGSNWQTLQANATLA